MPEGEFDVDAMSMRDFPASEDTPEAEQEEVVQTPETKPEEAEEETPEGEQPEADGTEDLDPDLKELGFPDLPEELRTDDNVRRYHETQYGIKKLLDTAKAEREEVRGHIEALAPYRDVIPLLADPATAKEGYERLGQILGVTQTEDTGDYNDFATNWQSAGLTYQEYQEAQKMGLSFPGEYKAVLLAEKRLAERFQLTDLAQERAQTKAEREFEAKVEREAPAVMGLLSRTEAGWGVTKNMVKEAMRAFPTLEPAKAVKALYADEFANHKAAKAAGLSKKGPEMPSGSSTSAKGANLIVKDPDDMTMDDIAHNMAVLNSQ